MDGEADWSACVVRVVAWGVRHVAMLGLAPQGSHVAGSGSYHAVAGSEGHCKAAKLISVISAF